MAAFGEYVLFKLATDESDRNKFDGEWLSGYFAGVTNRSNEYIIISGDRVYKAPTLRRRTDDEAYNVKVLEEMTAPFANFLRRGASTHRTEVVQDPSSALRAPRPIEPRSVPPNFKIQRPDFEGIGFTAGCKGCEQLITNAENGIANTVQNVENDRQSI